MMNEKAANIKFYILSSTGTLQGSADCRAQTSEALMVCTHESHQSDGACMAAIELGAPHHRGKLAEPADRGWKETEKNLACC